MITLSLSKWDLLAAAGLVLAVGGAFLISPGAGLLALGVITTAAGVAGSRVFPTQTPTKEEHHAPPTP